MVPPRSRLIQSGVKNEGPDEMMNMQPGKLGIAGNLGLLVLGFLTVSAVNAATFTVNVEDNDGNPVDGFRWILQEDTTFPVDPVADSAVDADDLDPDTLMSTSFHASHHPIAVDAAGNGLTGNSDISSAVVNAQDGARHYISVLPYSGYSISGQAVPDGATEVTVVVQKQPIPTATITVFLFHDNFPINGAPDLPEEFAPSYLPGNEPVPGPGGSPGTPIDWTAFNIIVEEPAGRYGIAGGQVIQDAFGNPLGTEYVRNCDIDGANPGMGTYGCLDADGAPIVPPGGMGDGTIHPDVNGLVTIRNLAPGKYGIVAIPPTKQAGELIGWQQTSTLEGTKVIDAWVKANEPPFFVEFGPPGPHVFIGFIKPSIDGGMPGIPAGGTADISGTITDMHLSRAPATQLHSGRPFPGCWVALNDNVGGAPPNPGLYAAPCDGDSGFVINDVPAGNYQLKVFDANMDVVIATQGITVNADGSCVGDVDGACGFDEIPVFNWFARLDTLIFNDKNQNGFQDPGELGIGPESQDVGIRWRDGTIYSNFPTDGEGFAPFDEVFPFFNWLVAEVSFGNKKATGATFVVDAGGPVNNLNESFPGFGALNPQPQVCTAAQSTNEDDPDFGCAVNQPIINPNTGDNLSRTETGQVLTAAFQGFLGQTSVMHWGKTDYLTFTPIVFNPGNPPTLPQYVGENGGISGIVYASVTRAENEPQFAAAEEWEPGVPRVQLALYADGDIDSFPVGDWPGTGDVDWNQNAVRDLDDDIIDDLNGDGLITLADVDNHPLGWADGTGAKGNEDVDRNGDGIFDLGDALQVTWTDSWDDSQPTGCQGANNAPNAAVVPAITDDRCFDGLRNFNQVRPGTFDGGFAFADYDLAHVNAMNAGAATAVTSFFSAISTIVSPDVFDNLQLGIIPGDYIVQSATPPGYKLMREEHKNVDFGDDYIPSPQALAVACVGEMHIVPQLMTMTTKDGSGALDQIIPGINAIDAAAPYAGELRPNCDLKKVPLSAGQNAGAEFFLMTDVPAAANVKGIILNDLANEFNPNSPSFSEKYAPPLMPVGFYDFNGKLVNRVYSDIYGNYNALVPSTFTANLPQPSGMSPMMLQACMNDASQVPNPDYVPPDPTDPDYDPNDAVDPSTMLDPLLRSAVQPVLLHVPVHAGCDDLPGYTGRSCLGIHDSGRQSAGLRAADQYTNDRVGQEAWPRWWRTVRRTRVRWLQSNRHPLGRPDTGCKPRVGYRQGTSRHGSTRLPFHERCGCQAG